MWKIDYPEAKIMVVDDQKTNLKLLNRLLTKVGYKEILLVEDPLRVCELYEEFHPDLLILDIKMKPVDGYKVMEDLNKIIPSASYFPILVLTGDVSSDARLKSLWLGAKDFLTKPFDSTEILLRIRNLLETRFLHMQLKHQNEMLEKRVMERTYELEESHLEILVRLARAAEYRDDDTGEHTWRVGRISALIAQDMGLADKKVKLILHAARLHDVGKIAIPDGILLKPARLTSEEFETMKTHTTLGAEILSGGSSPLLQMAETIALTHHEKWNGTGYPRGLMGELIPVEGRIVSVADVFDALTHDRPYKTAWPVEKAMDEIEAQTGKQFDPDVVEVFKKILPQILDSEHMPKDFGYPLHALPSNVRKLSKVLKGFIIT